jgi:hypothetical protein
VETRKQYHCLLPVYRIAANVAKLPGCRHGFPRQRKFGSPGEFDGMSKEELIEELRR